MKQTIGIIGYGRFGKILAQLLDPKYKIQVFDTKPESKSTIVEFVDFDTLMQNKTLFLAIPIRHFHSIVSQIADRLLPGSTIIDVCSVKVYPVKVMLQTLPDNINIIATHPMFGPDSFHSKSSLKMVMHFAQGNEQIYTNWRDYFQSQQIRIIEMTPEEHDRQAAYSQGVTHLIGRLLEKAKIQSTEIDTLGFRKLLELKQQTCQDSWELFHDLQHYNPYSKDMIQALKLAFQQASETD